MDLELTDEQSALRSVARGVLDARAPLSVARSFLDGGGNPAELGEELGELGWYEVGVDNADGVGVPGLCVLAFELGRHAAPSLLIDTVVVARVMLEAGDADLRSRWEEGLRSGTTPAALALLDESVSWDPSRVGARASQDGNGRWTLDGLKTGVQHGSLAAVIAVVAVADGAPGVFLLQPGTPGMFIERERALDPAGGCCSIMLDSVVVAADDVLTGPEVEVALTRGCQVGAVASAAEALGAATGCLEMAIAYVLERRQYGHQIGSYQAIQHLLADAYVMRETAWASTLFAAAAIDQGLAEAGEASAIAKAHAATASRTIAEAALQAFGGVGFTWEHDLHLLQRRALAAEQRFGDAHHHELALGALLAGRNTPAPSSAAA